VETILVSGCLLGLKCRYDEQVREIPNVVCELLTQGECLIPVCPEQLGGLPTPRLKNRLSWRNGKPVVKNENGGDVTAEFLKGAYEILEIAKLVSAEKAVFKSGSPSCGRDGVTTKLLMREGFAVEVIDSQRA